MGVAIFLGLGRRGMRWGSHIEVTDRAADGLIPFEDRVRLCQYNVKTDDIVKDMPHH